MKYKTRRGGQGETIQKEAVRKKEVKLDHLNLSEPREKGRAALTK